MILDVTINGQAHSLDCAADACLLDVLRAQGYQGVKAGCHEGVCGACTVLVDGQAVYACMTMAGQVQGRHITTIEGLGSLDRPHPLQQAFVDAGAVQCGFCTPGAILSAKALLDRSHKPTRGDIAQAMDGNLCRCTGYVKMFEAVEKVVTGGGSR
ncbi:MAG: (2Fe-2S)-binding protein [Pseudomonadota bacterium]